MRVIDVNMGRYNHTIVYLPCLYHGTMYKNIKI